MNYSINKMNTENLTVEEYNNIKTTEFNLTHENPPTPVKKYKTYANNIKEQEEEEDFINEFNEVLEMLCNFKITIN